jgi:hypothetical protein
MKKILITLAIPFLTILVAHSQFNWQGVLRDGGNDPITNQNVGVRMTIMKDGSAIMRETHNLTTTDIGLMTVEVCNGTNVMGDCASIDWSSGNFMLNVAVDETGGSNYADFGSSPILMVPRAGYAAKAGEAINDKVDDADADPANELQMLMFDNAKRELSISGVPGVIRIPSTGGDADFDPTNELQQLDKNPQGQIVLSHNNGFVVDGVVDDEVDDADADPENELQSLSLNGTDLSITGRNTVNLSGLGGGPTIWTKTGEKISYSTTTPGGLIEFEPGGYLAGFGGSQARRITGRPNRITDVLEFATPNSGQTHTIGQYIQDFPSPDNSQFFMSVDSDTLVKFQVTNWTSPGPRSRLDLFNYPQNTKVLGLRLEAAGAIGNFYQTVGNVIGVRMGAFAGGLPFVGVASANNPNTIVTFLSRDAMSAPVKNFFMDHPRDETKHIWYACIEGPEAAAYERGTAQLVNGEAFIPFSEHFEIVINPETMTVNLTPNSAESLGLAVVEKTATGIRVKELYKGQGNYQFDWEAKAVRKGYEDYKVIRPKSDMEILKEVHLD